LTREPGGTTIGRRIRSILLDPESRGINPLTELLLYVADRAEHVDRLIRPALAEGHVVLCDRYVDATVVYQGYARGLPIDLIWRMHRELLGGLMPDRTVLLDCEPAIGLSRVWKGIDRGDRSGAEVRFEQETLAFHEKVRQGYLELAGREPSRYRIVAAQDRQERVQEQVAGILAQLVAPQA
jgi:dTMP kinase